MYVFDTLALSYYLRAICRGWEWRICWANLDSHPGQISHFRSYNAQPLWPRSKWLSLPTYTVSCFLASSHKQLFHPNYLLPSFLPGFLLSSRLASTLNAQLI